MRRIWRVLISGLALALVTGCPVEQVVAPAEMPISENGVFTDDGRFFVVGGSSLYEVTGGPDTFQAKPLLEETCNLGGLTDQGNLLFAVCGDLDGVEPTYLLRVDPSDPDAPVVRRTEFPAGAGPMLLNGMDFGPDGALYISNSGSLLSGDPAVYRVHIISEDPLVIDVESFVDATTLLSLPSQGGGLAPNGIHFNDNVMYFARGLSIVRTRLRSNGSHGPLQLVYVAGGLNIIDDFDIVAGHLIIAQVNALGLLDPDVFKSELVSTDLNGFVKGRQTLSFIPSSTAVRRDTLFGPGAAVVTSYFNGGLYRVTP